jgi:hypothetical protein
MTKAQKQERAEAVEMAHKLLKPGDTVHTILRHVSRSGMLRRISPVRIWQEGQTYHLDHLANCIINGTRSVDNGDGVPMGGCGMDMGFELVYVLSRYLYPNGFECAGEGCPSNDHSNGDRDYSPHQHSDGGYALKQRWL